MVEISDITIIEIGLGVIIGVIIPLVVATWRSTLKQSKETTKMQDEIQHLRKESEKGDKAHEQIRHDVKDICTRLARIEGKLETKK